MQKFKKSEIYGAMGSIITGILLILLLLLLKFEHSKIVQPDQLPLALSEIEYAYQGLARAGVAGQKAGESSYFRPENDAVLATIKPKTLSPPNYATQNIENTIAMERAKAEEQRREAEALELIKKQQAEAERQRILAEQKAKADKAKEQMSGQFVSGNNTNTEGSTQSKSKSTSNNGGDAYDNNPVGSGSSNGHSWSLAGRRIASNIPKPMYNKNEEGKITINIRVDEQGKVISAVIGQPTTISSEELRNSTLQSAKQVKFSAGNGNTTGTLTYYFKLN
jgi:TonB family protein